MRRVLPNRGDRRMTKKKLTATHWGIYELSTDDGVIVKSDPYTADPEPSPIGRAIPDVVHHPLRIRKPAVRQGYLDNGPRHGDNPRGAEPFVEMEWDEALDLAAKALDDTKRSYGSEAIFGGSYGWASAGRFHHAQSQVHRFLNMHGGYVRSVNTYSCAAMEVILPHIICTLPEMAMTMPSWEDIAEHTDMLIAFGGLSPKNAQVNAGGVGRHTSRGAQMACKNAGVSFVNVSPIRNDTDRALEADWLAIRPNTDTAFMLGVAHTLVAEDIHDSEFVERYCVGFEPFRRYLMGETDGQPKNADWAARITEIPADEIRAIARKVANRRTLITVSWSLQRADHGEQSYWMGVVLAAMSGSMGLPGGGFGGGYGAVHSFGQRARWLPVGALPQGENPVSRFIPVARIADMLLNPGTEFEYDGAKSTYPDICLIYWCGGNPFHHHQDLNRLAKAWRRPETVIVHEPWWNALARRADIVFPAATQFERFDFAAGLRDNHIAVSQKAIPPVGEARSDFEIFSALAERLGFGDAFHENKSAEEWVEHLYETTRAGAMESGIELPPYADFLEQGVVDCPAPKTSGSLCAQLRNSKGEARLNTPSGKVEIFSETIASFDYDDCPGHPAWLEPCEWLGGASAKRFPLHLITNQPANKLHSQFDIGSLSKNAKIQGREPVTMNPLDAARRGVKEGEIVRVFNDRGSCLAGAVLSDDIRPGVVQIATGAWFSPVGPETPDGIDAAGNPNVLTIDKGTSRLAQGPSAHTCLVEVEPFAGTPPEIDVLQPPPFVNGRNERA